MDTTAVMQYLQGNPWLLTALIAWSLLWKAIALWHAARSSQLAWYSVGRSQHGGILEIIYLLFFRRKSTGSTTNVQRSKNIPNWKAGVTKPVQPRQCDGVEL